jgi:hypothetical protein
MCLVESQMTSANENAMDPAVQSFAERMMRCYNDAALALMVSIGHRTRLFDRMSEMDPATSREIADATGLSERYVREWLGALTTAGITQHNPATNRYWLPAERAALLTRAASPNNMAAVAQFFAVLGGAEDKVVDAFTHGRGVPYPEYRRFHEVMAEESGQTVVAALDKHILPLVPGLEERLERGIDVVDVGCGCGKALMHLAQRFPRSRFTGVDISQEATSAAIAEAAERGLDSRSAGAGAGAGEHSPGAAAGRVIPHAGHRCGELRAGEHESPDGRIPVHDIVHALHERVARRRRAGARGRVGEGAGAEDAR